MMNNRHGDFANPWYPDASHLWSTYDLFSIWAQYVAENLCPERRPCSLVTKWLTGKCST